MISWILIAILVLIGLFVIKLGYIRHKFFIIIIILLVLFLYVTMSLVKEQNDLDLTTTKGFFTSVKVYSGWLANGFQNLKVITGKAVKMDWKSTNGTFFDDKTKKSKRK